MNFLAHLFLSENDPEIMIGNFIADSVKGKAYLNYRPKIQQGILLHRKIDELTDNHIITKELGKLFKSHYQKYSGIVIDIFYDHFLCKNWNLFSDIQLTTFIKKCHNILLRNIAILPLNVQTFLPILIAKKRIISYSRIEGLQDALERMAKYTSLPEASNFAIQTLINNYEHFDQQFIVFFNELIALVSIEYQVIANKYAA